MPEDKRGLSAIAGKKKPGIYVPLSAGTQKLLKMMAGSPFWPDSPEEVAKEILHIALRSYEAAGWFGGAE